MAIESEITLSNQERGKEWEPRVIAVNKAGEGTPPSNTVTIVLGPLQGGCIGAGRTGQSRQR